jgi:hypothetical protein
MSSHIVAIDTYGSHRVRAPASGAMLSAYKLGNASVGRDVLLRLYGSQALDVTPTHAQYHYVSIAGKTCVHNGFLLLNLSDAELAEVETRTRLHPISRSGCWRWLAGKWHKFPTASNFMYVVAEGREGPHVDPHRYRVVSPSTGESEAITHGVLAEKRGQIWWLTGDTYRHKDTLKYHGCRWNRASQAWYYTGDTLPSGVQRLVDATPNISPEALSDDLLDVAEAQPAPITPHIADVPLIPVETLRVIPPQVEADDALLTSLQTVHISTPIAEPPKQLKAIGQAYVGELTGSITGSVYCYGYALHHDTLLYLNFGGPRMAVEAIRARLAKGETVNLVPWDAPAIELRADEVDGEAQTGRYSAYLNTLAEAKFTSAILVHEWLTTPQYDGQAVTGIFRTSEVQAVAQLLHLYHAGQRAGLVRTPRVGGSIDLLTVELDASAWTRLITGGLAKALIQLPEIPT